MKSLPNIISIALIGAGAAGFAIVSRPLLADKESDVPLNALGINRSPYGEVFAMAMQGSIGTYFHAAQGTGHTCGASGDCGHDHAPELAETSPGNSGKVMRLVESLAAGHAERTNPRPASPAHKFQIRRGIEDKLRFAYNLDPSHYGNYNAYHFFLTEPQLGTRPELTPMAAKLADQTIAYCLNQRSDPRMALTAAAAAGNVIELMLNDRFINPDKPNYTTTQMRSVLGVMDRSIGLYSHLADEWAEKGLWENLSALRVAETEERLSFVLRIRDGHEKSILRLEGLPGDSRTASQSVNREGSSLR
ncbi:hypothetical protein HZ994_16140 [Akkermansiaceae bacterium]|nr:hypothetical protein HZ994_16140 [Akkermansiaceae bacterium]